MKIFAKIFLAAAAFAFLGAGCIQFNSSSGSDGGVWVSADKGEHWVQKNAVMSVGGARSITGANVSLFVPDPNDPKTIYIATAGNGLLYTTDAGASWNQPKDLGSATVTGLALDNKNKCVVYATTGGMVVKTSDCTRSWSNVYEESRNNVALTAIAVDHFNTSVVYIATTKGDILKSTDAGASWVTIHVFSNQANKLAIDPSDSRVIYAGTKSSGIWKTTDAGATWADVSKGLEPFDGAKDFYDLVPDLSKQNSWVLVSRYGLIRTDDGGATWKKISLVTGPGQAHIYSFAMNPANGDEMYYSTATIFYKSYNGGANWATKRLPTSRIGSAMMVSAKDANTIYLGTLLIKK
jgi:photosystem II stability/assembly factor-like uncharacterized protein